MQLVGACLYVRANRKTLLAQRLGLSVVLDAKLTHSEVIPSQGTGYMPATAQPTPAPVEGEPATPLPTPAANALLPGVEAIQQEASVSEKSQSKVTTTDYYTLMSGLKATDVVWVLPVIAFFFFSIAVVWMVLTRTSMSQMSKEVGAAVEASAASASAGGSSSAPSCSGVVSVGAEGGFHSRGVTPPSHLQQCVFMGGEP